MSNLKKVKKGIDRQQEVNIINGNYCLVDLHTGEIIDTKIKITNYKIKLSNKKEFMKKWTDRKLNVTIKKDLTLLEKEILFDILDYFDEDNIIDFRRLAIDYQYSASKISKAKKGLMEKGLIAQKDRLFYLNPMVGIRTKEITQDLIDLFKDSIEKYNVEIGI